MRPGRNDPCHCGSGKKFKNCCIDKTERTSFAPKGDETTALERLLHFLELPRYHARMAESITRIVPRRLFEVDEPEFEEEIQNTLAETLQPSLYQALDDLGDHGKSLCDEFLASRDARDLDPFELEYLQRLLKTYIGLYEVLVPDASGNERVRECASGEIFTLRKAERDRLAPFEILLMRLVPRGDGLVDTEGMQLVMPTVSRDEFVSLLRELRSDEEYSELSDIAYKKATGALLYRAWIESIYPEDAPALDGEADDEEEEPEEMFEDEISRALFMIHDLSGCMAALLALPEVRPFGDSGAWLVFSLHSGTERLHHSRTIGRLGRIANLLTIETMTEDDLARVLEGVGPAIAPFAAQIDIAASDSTLEKIDELLDDEVDHLAEDHDPENCDECRGLATVSIEDLRAWGDKPHRGLRGKTPRQALADPSLRKSTIALARDLEREMYQQSIDHEADDAKRAVEPFVFSLLKDLGLDPNDPK